MYGNPNQFQGVYGKQYFEIDFWLWCEKTGKYEKPVLLVERFSGFDGPDIEDCYYGKGYIKINDETQEFEFELMLDYDGDVAIYMQFYDYAITHIYSVVN